MKLRMGTLLLLIVTGFGCMPEYLILESDYFIKERNYTFAIYNKENRLLTHPLKDLKVQINARKIQKRANNNLAVEEKNFKLNGDPITDVYVVAHGWNFTLQEGISSFNEYMESIEKEIGDLRQKHFQPFFILVAWPSATRPLTNLAKAALPFGIDDLLIPLSVPFDQALFFLPTVWKQSINATKNALGAEFPNDYLFQDPMDTGYGSVRGDVTTVGRDIPLSSLLFQLIQLKYDSAGNPHSFNIHVVGHSYGAKMSALASMESLRRWVIHEKYGEEIKGLWKDERVCFHVARDSQAFAKTLEGKDSNYKLSKAPDLTSKSVQEYCDKLKDRRKDLREKVGTGIDRSGNGKSVTHEMGNNVLEVNKTSKADSSPVKELLKFISKKYGDEQATKGKRERTPGPIESIVLFNPAMHPRELDYLIDASGRTAFSACGEEISMLFFQRDDCEHSLLKLIARKAIIFSNYDYANGWPFSVTQGLLNNSYSQKTETWMKNQMQKLEENMGLDPDRYYLQYPFRFLFNVGFGTVGLVAGMGGGLYSWGEGHLDPLIIPVTKMLEDSQVAKKGDIDLKMVDYTEFDHLLPVLPIPKIGAPTNELGFLWRPSMPALGRAGLRGLTKGKYTHDLKGLEPFYNNERSNIDQNGFCYSSYESKKKNTPLFFKIDRNLVYSFDATEVFNNGKVPLIGSHGDLRSLTPVPCHDGNVETNYIWNQVINNIKYKSPLQGLKLQGIEGSVVHISFTEDWAFLQEGQEESNVSDDQIELEQAILSVFRKFYSNNSVVVQPQKVRFWRAVNKPLAEQWETIIRPMVWSEVGKWTKKKSGLFNQFERSEMEKWFKGVSIDRIIGPTVYLEIPDEGDYGRIFHSSILDLARFVDRLGKTGTWANRLTSRFSSSTKALLEAYAKRKTPISNDEREEALWQEYFLQEHLLMELEKIIRGALLEELEPMQKMDLLLAYKRGQFSGEYSEQSESSHGDKKRKEPKREMPWDFSDFKDPQQTQLLNRLLLAREYSEVLSLDRTFFNEWEKTGLKKYGRAIVRAMYTKKYLEEISEEEWQEAGLAKQSAEIVQAMLQKEGISNYIKRVCLVKGKKKRPKRSYTFNFVYNFTKNECATDSRNCTDILSLLDSTQTPCWELKKPRGTKGKNMASKL